MKAPNEILLSIVADVFLIEGRGCVIVPGAPCSSATVPILRTGAPITLRRPDGTEIRSSIKCLEMMNRRPPTPFTPILLPSPISKSDVPIGTEVWYLPMPDDVYGR